MTTNQPPISMYIVTCLDTEDRCDVLKAVCLNMLAQRYPEFEVVVSDNAGSIRAEDALASIDDPRLKIFRNDENLGFSGNINLCMERCQYDIIKPNCDDDMIHPDCLALSVPHVNDETLVVVDYEKYIIGSQPTGIDDMFEGESPVEVRHAGYRDDFWKLPYIALPGCTLFTKKMFTDLGMYNDKAVVADWDFMMEVRLRRNVAHVKRTLCYMGIWDGSLTQQMLKSRPFFFPVEGLYTKFRMLHTKDLSARYRFKLRIMLGREFISNTLRLILNCKLKKYRDGYRIYYKRKMNFIREGKNMVDIRPAD